jgi:hypothetical protein
MTLFFNPISESWIYKLYKQKTMKTALDWLIEQMPYEFRANHTQELFRQAKEKEKEQIMMAYNDGFLNAGLKQWKTSTEYYNQTYEQQKQHIIDIMKADEDDGLYNQNI